MPRSVTRLPRREPPPLTAASMHPSRCYHVLTAPQRPSDLGRPACGSEDFPVMSARADQIPPDRRCAEDGCYERWPSIQAAIDYLRVAASPWGLRAAKENPDGP